MDRYEEALERARAAIKDCGDNLGRKKMIYGIFPELQESEDKRIARAINNMLPFIPDRAYNNNGVTKVDVLAWLEKQKEQKAVQDSVAVVITNRPTISKFEAGKAAVLNNPEEYGLCKPAEWSEEDKKMLGKVVECITYVADRNLLDGDVSETRLKAWLLSHLTHGPHWRKAKEGSNLPESIILPDGEEPRFGKCAVNDSYYIPISELKELPKE